MPTIAREIDALGGAPASDDHDAVVWNSGYDRALELAEPIAENADALVEELLELIEDMLNGNRRLEPETKPLTNPGEATMYSIAISLKRIADALDSSESGGRPQGTVLWWLEMIASAANAGRS